MANLTAAEADREYLRILGELHRFAHQTGGMPGVDVINWFRSVGIGLHDGRGERLIDAPPCYGRRPAVSRYTDEDERNDNSGRAWASNPPTVGEGPEALGSSAKTPIPGERADGLVVANLTPGQTLHELRRRFFNGGGWEDYPEWSDYDDEGHQLWERLAQEAGASDSPDPAMIAATQQPAGEGVPWLQMIYELRHPERERVGWQDNADLMRSAADEIERLAALSATQQPVSEGVRSSSDHQMVDQARTLFDLMTNKNDLGVDGAWVIETTSTGWRVKATRQTTHPDATPYSVVKATTRDRYVAALLTFMSTGLPRLCDLADAALTNPIGEEKPEGERP